MKKFTVTVEQRTIQIQQCEVQIDADNEAEARILAKYRQISAYEWQRQPDENVPRQVVKVEDHSSAAYQVAIDKAISGSMNSLHEDFL